MVRMDLARIKEVLMQLLENAAKYSPEEAPIHITAEVKNEMLTTSVADHGPGIDDFEQSLIFEKFYRGRNQRLRIQGTGMGLAIVKAIVEAHGGTVGSHQPAGQRVGVLFFSSPHLALLRTSARRRKFCAEIAHQLEDDTCGCSQGPHVGHNDIEKLLLRVEQPCTHRYRQDHQ